MREYVVIEKRIDCWNTVFEMPEFDVKGQGREGLIQALAEKLDKATSKLLILEARCDSCR